jgi:tRNA threonylcarbamoyladenosine dehydratase
VEVADLADATHDPLLAALRQQVRCEHGARRQGRIGLTAVFSREEVKRPTSADMCVPAGGLNCQGYGSGVTVTAAFGLAAAEAAMEMGMAACPAAAAAPD